MLNAKILVMKKFVFLMFTLLSALLLGCSPSSVQGPGDFGGGNVELKKVTSTQIEVEVERVDKVKGLLFNYLEHLYRSDDLMESFTNYKPASLDDVVPEKTIWSGVTKDQFLHMSKYLPLALKKIFGQNPTINQVLEITDLETNLKQPCRTFHGVAVDESIFGSSKNKVCISGHMLAKKLTNLSLSKAVFSIAMHGLAHKAGADEDEAKAVEYYSYTFPDTLVTSMIENNYFAGRVELAIERLDTFTQELQGSLVFGEKASESNYSATFENLSSQILSYEDDESLLQKRLQDVPVDDKTERIDIRSELSMVEEGLRFNRRAMDYLVSGDVIHEILMEDRCRELKELLDILPDSSMRGTDLFYFGKKQLRKSYELRARLSLLHASFCRPYYVALQLEDHYKKTASKEPFLVNLFESPIFHFGNQEFTVNTELRGTYQKSYWLSDVDTEQRFPVVRPGHRGDLLRELTKVRQVLVEFQKSYIF